MSGLPFNLDDLINTRAVEQNRVEFKGTWDEYIKVALRGASVRLPMTSLI